MINSKQLLEDLQLLLKKTIEPDLRERSELPEIEAELKAEFEKAKKAERTALTYTQWRADYITQIGAAWVLSSVFIRFLEDNDLIDPPKLSGPAHSDDGSQTPLQRARDEYDLYIKANPAHSFREYILSVIDELAKLPGENDIFGDKNIMHQQPGWLSNDAAKVLYNFWQKVDPATGHILHDFTDVSESEMYDTRFLGDLYQDLSEAARKKFALLQTPDFVEEFILDRTLEPALDEFGLEPGKLNAESDSELTADRYFKVIDPACGSGHFLLGAFPRILRRWQQKEPGTKVDALVQRTLDSIHGVDINPFAIAIARFRLLLAALKACGIERLRDAIDFDLSNLACGDSLYHGRQKQKTLGDWTDESHYFQTEDADNLRRILQEGTFHAVVANPPYIQPKDKAAKDAYRRHYISCHRQFSLAAPFMEQVFQLAKRRGETDEQPAGFTGQITANSFMKREFGKKLIESFFPTIEITHAIDTSGAIIPGHGTPTVIIFGRNRSPRSSTVRVLMGLRGEQGLPADPRTAEVWTAIMQNLDVVGADNLYIDSQDLDRNRLHTHPWSFSGGGAGELKVTLDESNGESLGELVETISVICKTREDDAYMVPNGVVRRNGVLSTYDKVAIRGENIRDWGTQSCESILYPYDDDYAPVSYNAAPLVHEFLWSQKELLWRRKELGGDHRQLNRTWWEWNRFLSHWHKSGLSICYAEVATHNEFTLLTNLEVPTGSAPAIKLGEHATVEDYCSILGILNSSTTCFWLKQVCHNKGAGGGSRVDAGYSPLGEDTWESHFAFNGGRLRGLPLPKEKPTRLSVELKCLTASNSEFSAAIVSKSVGNLEFVKKHSADALRRVIRLQDDLDWKCYRLYGLLEEDLAYPTEASLGINLGERTFEIVMARKMAAGELQTTWFERHGSTPITEIPDHWPEDYKQLVQRRIEIIESNPNIALIEQPEYKRRWNTEPWESQVDRAMKSWLLDRLESYFDFDGRMNDDGNITAHASMRDPRLVTVAKLADIAAKDEQFHEVAEVYRDRGDFDIVKLVDELVSEEHVPALPILRYKPSGLDKLAEWEKTWELQRQEDAIDARIRNQLDGLLKMGGKKKDKEGVFRKHLSDDSPVLEFFSDVKKDSSDEGEEGKTESLDNFLTVDEIVRRVVKQEIGEIPVPPKYASKDMISTGGAKYWKLRGKLDVPKERWVSFPHSEGEDQTLVIAWAGYDHLQLTRAIAAYFAEVQQTGGSEDPRLVPLLAAMDQQIPWVKQWHNEIDPEFGYPLGDYFESFIEDEARNLDLTVEDVRKWEPPKNVKKKKATQKKATRKKPTKENEGAE